MSYKLLAFDLDGTFLKDDKSIPPENLRALEAAAARGVHIVPATGRVIDGVPEPISRLPFVRYTISINGSYVYDAVEEKVIYRAEIPVELSLRICEYMDSLPLIYDCYQDNRGWMTRWMYDKSEEYFASEPYMLEFFRRMRSPVEELKETLRTRGRSVQKLQMHFRPDQMEERQKQMERIPRLFPDVVASCSLSNNIEMNSARAGKGLALRALCAALGIGTDEAIAFGDGSNDTDMLRAAGRGVAMANAQPAVMAVADAVTASNNEAGVAQEIWRLLEQGVLG